LLYPELVRQSKSPDGQFANQAAVDNNFHVEGVPFRDGTFLDIGIPDSLLKAIRHSVLQERIENE
jgi:glucose-1-phosphate thymidylyltransferase